MHFQKVPKVSSVSSGCAEVNKDKASRTVDNLKILNIQKVSTGVSSGVEPSKIKVAVDTVDKKRKQGSKGRHDSCVRIAYALRRQCK